MENMTSNLAKVLIVAAMLRLLNAIEYTPIAQLGFTIAALLITIADMKQYTYEVLNKASNASENKKRIKTINGYHFWAVFFLVAVPNIRFEAFSKLFVSEETIIAMKNFFGWYMTNINDFCTLLALGLAIYTMSHKKNQRYLETRENSLTVIDGNLPTGSRGDKDVR